VVGGLASGAAVANAFARPAGAGTWTPAAHGGRPWHWGSPSAPSSPATSASASATPTAIPATATPTPAPTRPKPTPTSTTPAATGASAAAQAVLDQVNARRSAAGLRPYTMASGLVASAHKHTLLMIGGCGLQHQCPGEAGLGARISAEGVRWNAIAENIGLRGWFANNAAAITGAGKQVDQDFFNEGPGGGHHDALMSATYTRIGIDVLRDKDGLVYVTEDFAN
jgi:uncharacterized protein YkwD